jgi:hypothetical protein
MNTLDTLVQEALKRIQASGGKAWMAPDSSDEMKLAFLEALMDRRDCKEHIRTTGRIIGIARSRISC